MFIFEFFSKSKICKTVEMGFSVLKKQIQAHAKTRKFRLKVGCVYFIPNKFNPGL